MFPLTNRTAGATKIAPVALMRLTTIDSPEDLLKKYDKSNIAIERKYDGFKIQVIKQGGVKLYSRRGLEKTENFPELIKQLSSLPNNTFVEGEIIYIENGKQILEKVISLVNSSAEKSQAKAKELPGKMSIYLYDILWYKGKFVGDKPHSERRKLLESAVKPTKNILLSKQYPFDKWKEVIKESVAEGGEGIVIKLKDKPYKFKPISEKEPKPADIMYKYKKSGGKSDSDDFVVYDYKLGDKGKLKAQFGQYHKGKLYHISEISNFTKNKEEEIKKQLKSGPFVVEIGFGERVPKGLRHQHYVRDREDKKPKDATMSKYHIEHIDGLKTVEQKADDVYLSKRAGVADEALALLEKKVPKGRTAPSFTGLRTVPGVDVQKAYKIISSLESGNNYIIGDSGTSFGATQVQFGSFVNKLAQAPNVERLTGMTQKEFIALGNNWNSAKEKMKNVNLWIQVDVNEDEIKAYVRQNPTAVVRRSEGTTIRYIPGTQPGVTKIKNGRYIGYVLDLARLKEVGLNIDSPYIMSQLKTITGEYITEGVVRNAIVKLFIAQESPDAYNKFQQAFSKRNVNSNQELRSLTDRVVQQDFMNRVNAVVAAVSKSGYNTNSTNAYNIYQLIAISNAAGVGAVQVFLFKRKPFSASQKHYLNRANKMIAKVTGISTDFPADGLGGFTKTAFLLSKRAGEFDDEPTRNEKPSGPTHSQIIIAYAITLRRFWEELNRGERELFHQVRKEVEEELGKKLNEAELKKILENRIYDYIVENWENLPTKQSSFFISKRAAEEALYFPGQYADEIKSGKRQLTIRPDDIPFQVGEVVKCMTYSGGYICDVKILSKEMMSVIRLRKAYGKHMADALEHRFGPDKRYMAVKFETVNSNMADDDDEKWDEVLIEKDDVKLTRQQIRDHYEKPDIRKKIMARIKDKPILIYIGTKKNENILKRKHNDKEIVITNANPETSEEDPHNYLYWTKRRLLSIHEVFGTKTDLGFVDLDIHGDYSLPEATKYAKALSKKLEGKPIIYQSGGSGLHIEFKTKAIDIDKLREELKDLLIEFNEDWDSVTTGLVKGNGMRSDVSTLHNKGSLRVPWALGETYGKVKKPVGQDANDNGTFGDLHGTNENWPVEDGVLANPPTPTTDKPEIEDYSQLSKSLMKEAREYGVKEEYIWMWDDGHLYVKQNVKDEQYLGVQHLDLAIAAGLRRIDDEENPRGFVTFYYSGKPKISTYGKSFLNLKTQVQDKVENKFGLIPGQYNLTVIDMMFASLKADDVNTIYAIWKFADEETDEWFKQHPEFQEDPDYMEIGEEVPVEEEEVPVPKLKIVPKRVVVKPEKKPAPEMPKGQEEPATEPETVKTKRQRQRRRQPSIVKKLFDAVAVKPPEASPENIEPIKEPIEEPAKIEPVIETKTEPKEEAIPEKVEPSESEILLEDWLTADEEEGDLEEAAPSKEAITIFGVKLNPPVDKRGDVLSDWPTIGDLSKISPEAQQTFMLDNLKDGPSIRKLFADPRTWLLLKKEPHLLQTLILPVLINVIGKIWFIKNSSKKTIEGTPFGLFDEADIGAISSGTEISELPKTKKYIQEINKSMTEVINKYLTSGYGDNLLPIDGVCYTALNRTMMKIVAKENGFKDKRFPVCSVCRAKQSKHMAVPFMVKIGTALWACEQCKRKADELSRQDLAQTESELIKANKNIEKYEQATRQAKVNFEDADTETQKKKAKAKLEIATIDLDKSKYISAELSKKKEILNKEINILEAQTAVPYVHTWCPNEYCPGQRVPLTSIDWNSDFWKTSNGKSVAHSLKTQYRIDAPDASYYENVQNAEEKKQRNRNIPPDWMLAIPFICPHDGVKFTLKEAKGKGYDQKAGFLWMPFQRSAWMRAGDHFVSSEVAEQVGASSDDTDEKLAYEQLGSLARHIFLKKYNDKSNELFTYLAEEEKKGIPRSSAISSQSYIKLMRQMSLYDTTRDFSALTPEVFIGWLAGHEFGKSITEDKDGIISSKNVIKDTFRQDKEEIYLPLLQSWTDKMLKTNNGFEVFKLKTWLTTEKEDGIPHLDQGAYFVSKVGSVGKQFGFECGLKLKTRPDGTPLRQRSGATPKLLRILGVWVLAKQDIDFLKKYETTRAGVLAGTNAIDNLKIVNTIIKDKQDRKGDVVGHDYLKATLDNETSLITPDSYILVKALIMPGVYDWDPIKYIRDLRKDSDSDDVFYKFGQLVTGQSENPEFWRNLVGKFQDVEDIDDLKTQLIDLTNEELAKRVKPVKELKLPEEIQKPIEKSELYRPEKWELEEEDVLRPEKWEPEEEPIMRPEEWTLEAFVKHFISKRANLSTYEKKRDFSETDEPEGKAEKTNKHRFVIQKHDATNLHFDLRLENDEGTMSSWAIPKHKLPSDSEKLLAVKTEDHPVSYNKFEGEIPEGEYGAGSVEIYDSGTYEEIEWTGKKIVFKLKGGGTYNLIKTDGKNWLLMKAKEQDAKDGGSRVLYHIGRRPPRPVPFGDKFLYRPYLDEVPDEGLFLTDNYIMVAINHGKFGNVYAYRIPEWVIREAGGLHIYDSAKEIIISEELWKKVKNEIKFLGKVLDKTELMKKITFVGKEPGFNYENSEWPQISTIIKDVKNNRLSQWGFLNYPLANLPKKYIEQLEREGLKLESPKQRKILKSWIEGLKKEIKRLEEKNKPTNTQTS